MSLTKFSGDVDVIAALGDNPITDNNLTAAQFKAKFDRAANLLKTFINSTLTAEIDTLITAINNMLNGNIDTANIKNGAITTAKIDDGQVTLAKMATDSVDTSQIKDGAVTADKLDPNLLADEVEY